MSGQKIEPALTPEEWQGRLSGSAGDVGDADVYFRDGRLVYACYNDCCAVVGPHHIPGGEIPALIALANAALPDGDRRKITRERVEALRAWVPGLINHGSFRELAVLLHHHCDAIGSYLPPESREPEP